MYEDLVFDLQIKLNHITKESEPETSEDLSAQLAGISEAMELCERAMLQAATSTVHRDDVVTYLFEYKQLMKVQRHLNKMSWEHLPSSVVPEPVASAKKWWKPF